MSRSLSDDLHDPHLFDENEVGVYSYETNVVGGRSVSGSLEISFEPIRNGKAQREAGGNLRRGSDNPWGHDDGGHLIGARFGGSPTNENLTAQDSNLNRSAYKAMENSWAEHLDQGDKVFVSVETSASDRPDAYMGYAIIEHPDGSRDFEAFSYANESAEQQQGWQEEFEHYEAENYWAEEETDYLGSAGAGTGTLEGMDADELQSFNAAWDEQLVTPTEGIDDGMEAK